MHTAAARCHALQKLVSPPFGGGYSSAQVPAGGSSVNVTAICSRGVAALAAPRGRRAGPERAAEPGRRALFALRICCSSSFRTWRMYRSASCVAATISARPKADVKPCMRSDSVTHSQQGRWRPLYQAPGTRSWYPFLPDAMQNRQQVPGTSLQAVCTSWCRAVTSDGKCGPDAMRWRLAAPE